MRNVSGLISAGAVALLAWTGACGGTVEEHETGEGGGGGQGGTVSTTTPTGTTATGTGSTGTGSTGSGTQTGGTGGCDVPLMPDSCAEVGYFECGFMASCTDGLIVASWHEHWEMECGEIIDFACEYTCPYGCVEGEFVDWPQDGAELIEGLCLPAGSGGSGASGSGTGGGG
ncbi:MAG: hypothetical protein JRI23_05960 [Deltaproteobacteria bacterium]|jgi:hypothetical protein|nr:hypothetical protein [Deltaproteobacteria bacterium]MBW2531108.1 hypothetical protein [Deltaproteobacteria bacterium]